MSDNLAELIDRLLPPELTRFLREVGLLGEQRRQSVYLVGGVVRDLFLGRPNLDLDLDLVVEGDAIEMARCLEQANRGEAVVHAHFGTARVSWQGMRIDLATARSETYARPGALPAVTPGDIRSDLVRRDFTMNAMAVSLAPRRYGDVLDLYGGRRDLENKFIRVLHERSFIDDPTRLWRAVRYEQRLEFHIEPLTFGLIGAALPVLDAVSGDRIRNELWRVLREELPEKALCRAAELGILGRLHPGLKADGWLARRFGEARAYCLHGLPMHQTYVALLAYRLGPLETDRFISYLKLPSATQRVLREMVAVKSALGKLGVPGLKRSQVFSVLSGNSPAALVATLVAAETPVVREGIGLYLTSLRHIKPLLTGDDLKKMGVPQGPRIGQILGALREARLDGAVTSREDEISLAKRLLAG